MSDAGDSRSDSSDEEDGRCRPSLPPFLASDKAFFVFSPENGLRSTAISIWNHPYFSRFILIVIIANSVSLAIVDPLCVGHGPLPPASPNSSLACTQASEYCSAVLLAEFPCDPPFCHGFKSFRKGYTCNEFTQIPVDRLELVFVILFFIEMLIGMLALGVFGHKHSYLRSPWNWVDFIVVIFGLVSYIPGQVNVSVLRFFRILRPLRTVRSVPGLRVLVASLLQSLGMLVNVVGLYAFIFLLFGITGLQLMLGRLRSRCVFTRDPWFHQLAEVEEFDVPAKLCSYDSEFGRQCQNAIPPGGNVSLPTLCSQLYNNGETFYAPVPNPAAFAGSVNFDNIGSAFFTIFQVIAIEGWEVIWYRYEEAWNVYLARIYFGILIIVGAFFVVNLALAVISDNFTACTATEKEELAYRKSRTIVLPSHTMFHTFASATGRDTDKAMHSYSRLGLFGKFRRFGRGIIVYPWFQNAIVVLILVNFVFLCADYHSQPVYETKFLEKFHTDNSTYIEDCVFNEHGYLTNHGCGALMKSDGHAAHVVSTPDPGELVLSSANLALTTLFALEILLKFVSLGPWKFQADRLNMFDAMLVTVAFAEAVLSYWDVLPFKRILCVGLMFRTPRVLRRIKSTTLRKIIGMLRAAVVSVLPLLVLFALLVFIFSLLGNQFFGGLLKSRRPEVLGSNPRSNFDGFLPEPGPEGGYGSLVTVFQILTADGWHKIAYNCIHATGSGAAVYFVLLVLTGRYLLINLFSSVLLAAATSQDDDNESIITGMPLRPPVSVVDLFIKLVRCICDLEEQERMDVDDDDDDDDFGFRGTKLKKSAVVASSPNDDYYESDAEYDPDVPYEQQWKTIRRRKRPNTKPEYDPTKPYEQQWASWNNEWKSTRAHEHESMVSLKQQRDVTPYAPDHSSLFMFSGFSKIRRFCYRVCSHVRFEQLSMFLIIANSVLMAFEDPALPPSNNLVWWIKVLDLAFLGLFSAEMVIKVIAYGFALHEHSYMRNGWNVLDFFIVVVSVIAATLVGASDVRALRFRVFRVLRPLRFMRRNPGMKLVVDCLLGCLVSVFHLLWLITVMFLMAGIVGMQLYKGKFYRCYEPEVVEPQTWIDEFDFDVTQVLGLNQTEVANLIVEKTLLGFGDPKTSWVDSSGQQKFVSNWLDCLDGGGIWKLDEQNFDHIGMSVLTLFQMASGDSWVRVMNNGLDAGIRPGMAPIRMQNPGHVLFFVFVMFLFHFFVLNFFLGVVFETYISLQDTKMLGLMTPRQKRWAIAVRGILRVKPVAKPTRPANTIRAICYDIASHKFFSYFVVGMIMCNAALLGSRHYGMPLAHENFLAVAEWVFAVLFFDEMSLKMMAYGVKKYFSSHWNKFDALVVLGSILGLLPQLSGIGMFQVFRLLRLVRLLREMRGINKLLSILLFSLPSLVNVGMVLLLVVYVYAVMGVQLFWNAKRHLDYIDEHANFKTFSFAFFTLFRVTTGVGWSGIMNECAHGVCHSCNPYWLSVGKCDSGCGGWFVSVAFFVSYTFLTVFIVLNLFIAIILDNFTQEMSGVDAVVGRENIELLNEAWLVFDPRATLTMEHTDLYGLLRIMPPPLGCGPGASRAEIHKVMADLDLVLYEGFFTYEDLFHALSFLHTGVPLPPVLQRSLLKQRVKRTKSILAKELKVVQEQQDPLAHLASKVPRRLSINKYKTSPVRSNSGPTTALPPLARRNSASSATLAPDTSKKRRPSLPAALLATSPTSPVNNSDAVINAFMANFHADGVGAGSASAGGASATSGDASALPSDSGIVSGRSGADAAAPPLKRRNSFSAMLARRPSWLGGTPENVRQGRRPSVLRETLNELEPVTSKSNWTRRRDLPKPSKEEKKKRKLLASLEAGMRSTHRETAEAHSRISRRRSLTDHARKASLTIRRLSVFNDSSQVSKRSLVAGCTLKEALAACLIQATYRAYRWRQQNPDAAKFVSILRRRETPAKKAPPLVFPSDSPAESSPQSSRVPSARISLAANTAPPPSIPPRSVVSRLNFVGLDGSTNSEDSDDSPPISNRPKEPNHSRTTTTPPTTPAASFLSRFFSSVASFSRGSSPLSSSRTSSPSLLEPDVSMQWSRVVASDDLDSHDLDDVASDDLDSEDDGRVVIHVHSPGRHSSVTFENQAGLTSETACATQQALHTAATLAVAEGIEKQRRLSESESGTVAFPVTSDLDSHHSRSRPAIDASPGAVEVGRSLRGTQAQASVLRSPSSYTQNREVQSPHKPLLFALPSHSPPPRLHSASAARRSHSPHTSPPSTPNPLPSESLMRGHGDEGAGEGGDRHRGSPDHHNSPQHHSHSRRNGESSRRSAKYYDNSNSGESYRRSDNSNSFESYRRSAKHHDSSISTSQSPRSHSMSERDVRSHSVSNGSHSVPSPAMNSETGVRSHSVSGGSKSVPPAIYGETGVRSHSVSGGSQSVPPAIYGETGARTVNDHGNSSQGVRSLAVSSERGVRSHSVSNGTRLPIGSGSGARSLSANKQHDSGSHIVRSVTLTSERGGRNLSLDNDNNSTHHSHPRARSLSLNSNNSAIRSVHSGHQHAHSIHSNNDNNSDTHSVHGHHSATHATNTNVSNCGNTIPLHSDDHSHKHAHSPPVDSTTDFNSGRHGDPPVSINNDNNSGRQSADNPPLNNTGLNIGHHSTHSGSRREVIE